MKQQQSRKVFLNNMNCWMGNFIIEELRNETSSDYKVVKNLFCGTLNNTNCPLPKLFEPEIIKFEYKYYYENSFFDSNSFIFNTFDSDLDELEYLIRGLSIRSRENEKSLIIISNILTWAATPLKENPSSEKDETYEIDLKDFKSNEFEENKNNSMEDLNTHEEAKVNDSYIMKKKYYKYTDKDYNIRKPSHKYKRLVYLENLAYSLANENFKVYTVCPGFIYGCGENFFFDYFKASWFQSPSEIPIIENGENFLPTIHIIDLAKTIKRVVENKPNERYILAVDRTKNTTMKSLMQSISNAIGSGKIKNVYSNDIPDIDNFQNFTDLNVNLNMKTSNIYIDERGKNEDFYEFKKRIFEWHCEFGISENQEKIRNEFKLYRKLKSIRIFITGQPGSGKTFIASEISKELRIPHLKLFDMIEEAKISTKPIGDEVREKMEEIIKKHSDEYDAMNVKKKIKNPPPFERDSVTFRFSEELLTKIVKSKLNDNLCSNLGYVLDGYPRNSNEAKALFFKEKEGGTNIPIQQINEKPKDAKEGKDLKNKNQEQYIVEKVYEDLSNLSIDQNLAPMLVLLIESMSEDFIKSRLKEKYNLEDHLEPYSEERINKRLHFYKAWNDQSLNNIHYYISLPNLLKEYNFNILDVDGKTEAVEFLTRKAIDKIESVSFYKLLDV